MSDAVNPMAQAWRDASRDLGIRVEHPFVFQSRSGVTGTTSGVFLPDFGSPNGTLLLCRFDPEWLDEAADDTDYFQSVLNPHHYEPYDRETYIEALNDWGWFGDPDETPCWFQGRIAKHGGTG